MAETTARIARTYTARNGKSVASDLTDAEALAICAAGSSDFARDLARKAKAGPLTEQQVVWMHILAVEQRDSTPAFRPAAQVEPETPAAPEFPRIAALLKTAGGHLKRPAIALVDEHGTGLALKLAGGWIHVTDGGDYGADRFYGSLGADGRMGAKLKAELPAATRALLERIEADPAAEIGRLGRLAGRCCFCCLKLTDERSTAVGYGQQCSRNFGLPWGHQVTDLAVEPLRRARARRRSAVGSAERAKAMGDERLAEKSAFAAQERAQEEAAFRSDPDERRTEDGRVLAQAAAIFGAWDGSY